MLTALHLAGRARRRRPPRPASGSGTSPSAGTPRRRRSRSRDAERALDEQRFRALGVRLEQGDASTPTPRRGDGEVPDRATLLSPFDRLVHDRDRRRGALGTSATGSRCTCRRAKREYGYYVLPLLVGDRLVGRAEPVLDRGGNVLRARRRLGRHLAAGRGARRARRRSSMRSSSRPSGDLDRLLRHGRQALAAVLGDDDHVLDPDADVAREVDPRLDGDDVPAARARPSTPGACSGSSWTSRPTPWPSPWP